MAQGGRPEDSAKMVSEEGDGIRNDVARMER